LCEHPEHVERNGARDLPVRHATDARAVVGAYHDHPKSLWINTIQAGVVLGAMSDKTGERVFAVAALASELSEVVCHPTDVVGITDNGIGPNHRLHHHRWQVGKFVQQGKQSSPWQPQLTYQPSTAVWAIVKVVA
jgi:hypothetical protein